MKKSLVTRVALTAILGLPGQVLASAAPQDCAQIENARERLACFDAQYPRDPDKPFIDSTPLRPRTAPQPSSAVAAPTPQTGGQRQTDRNTGQVTPPNEDAPIRGQTEREKRLFDRGPDIDFTTTIAAIKAEPQQKMVFRLENGQVWIQTAPRTSPFEVGDSVTIKSAMLGGYIMRSEGGTSTRVTRIQ